MYRTHGDADRFCRATTHKSCRRCKFYEPTTQATFRACFREVEYAEILTKTINSYMEQIQSVKDIVLDAEECYRMIQAEADKMIMLDFSMKALWEDSVNTFE